MSLEEVRALSRDTSRVHRDRRRQVWISRLSGNGLPNGTSLSPQATDPGARRRAGLKPGPLALRGRPEAPSGTRGHPSAILDAGDHVELQTQLGCAGHRAPGGLSDARRMEGVRTRNALDIRSQGFYAIS